MPSTDAHPGLYPACLGIGVGRLKLPTHHPTNTGDPQKLYDPNQRVLLALQPAKGMLARKKVTDQTPALVTSASKKIFAYTKTGLVQLQDKIVARFALTIYPYSLDETATRKKKQKV